MAASNPLHMKGLVASVITSPLVSKTEMTANPMVAIPEGTLTPNGIPVRDVYRVLYNLERRAMIRAFILHLVTLFAFSYIVLSLHPTHDMFMQDDGIASQLLNEGAVGIQDGDPYNFDFFQIDGASKFFQWARGPLLNGLFPTVWYNGNALNASLNGSILGTTARLMGGVQLRQVRVKSDSCAARRMVDTYGARFDTMDGTCYSEFENLARVMETASFGPPDAPARYTWSSGHSGLYGLTGFGPGGAGTSYYGTGGYITELPAGNHTNAARMLDQLFSDKWIDRATRAVAVDFNLYNTVTRLLSVVRLVAEFSPAGNVLVESRVVSLRPVVYITKLDAARSAAEGFWVLMVLWQLKAQLHTIGRYHVKRHYFCSFKHIFNFGYVTSCLFFVAFWISVVRRRAALNIDVNDPKYLDLFDAASSFRTAMRLASLIMLMQIFKLFTFMALSRRLSLLWLTLRAAAEDLFSVIIVLALLVTGFSFLASIIFGPFIKEYHTVVSSLSAVLRCTLGDFDYAKMSQVAPDSAPLFFTTYMVLVWAIIINAFVATLSYYNEVVQEQAVAHAKVQDVTIEFNVAEAVLRRCQNIIYYLSCCTHLGCCARLLPQRLRQSFVGRGIHSAINKTTFRKTMAETLAKSASFTEQDWRQAAEQSGLSSAQFHHEREHIKEKQLEAIFASVQDQVMESHKHSLFEMIEKMHLRTIGKNVYLSVDELANFGVVRKEAERIVTMFFENKDVYSVGLITRQISLGAPNVFEARAITQFGRLQRRVLVVDVANECLRSLQPKTLSEVKEIPLTSMLQLEKTNHDARRLDVIFRGYGCMKLVFESSEAVDSMVEMLLAWVPGGVNVADPEDDGAVVGHGVIHRSGVHHVSHEESIRNLLKSDGAITGSGSTKAMDRWGSVIPKLNMQSNLTSNAPKLAVVATQAMAAAKQDGSESCAVAPRLDAGNTAGASAASVCALDRRVTALAAQQSELHSIMMQLVDGQRRVEEMLREQTSTSARL